MATFLLTKEAALAAARKAWSENRLSAQHDGVEGCRYRENGRCCAIGAGLPDDLGNFDSDDFNTLRVTRLLDDGYLATDDRNFLFDLQQAHDDVCRAMTPFERAQRMARFCALIGVEPPEGLV